MIGDKTNSYWYFLRFLSPRFLNKSELEETLNVFFYEKTRTFRFDWNPRVHQKNLKLIGNLHWEHSIFLHLLSMFLKLQRKRGKIERFSPWIHSGYPIAIRFSLRSHSAEWFNIQTVSPGPFFRNLLRHFCQMDNNHKSENRSIVSSAQQNSVPGVFFPFHDDVQRNCCPDSIRAQSFQFIGIFLSVWWKYGWQNVGK